MRKLTSHPARRAAGGRRGPILASMTNADSLANGETPTLADRPGAEPKPVRGGANVLLIEDEPGIVDFVRRGLEAEGFTVEAASDGVQGERMALSGDFDAVVLDLMLPRRS